MSNEKIDELKVKFETGKIPDGDDYALFIDNTYNRYRIVDMFNPDDAPKTFNEGENVLVFKYERAKNPEWHALLGDGVADGDIMVRTFHYAGAGVTFQEFDTERNGRFYAGRSRVAIDDDTWGPINLHPEIRTVNGNGPDINGNIVVGDGSGELIVSKPEVTFHTYTYEYGATNWVYEFDIIVPNYNAETDVIELYKTGLQNPNRVKEVDFEVISYTEPTLRIGLLNGERTNRDYPIGLWRYKYSNKPRLTATVVDGFGSTSAEDASSINNATILNNKITTFNDDLDYISEALKAHMQQYANNEGDPGHVILDGTTIVRNADGTISAVGGGGVAGITHVSPISPDVSGEEYPEGVSIFKFNYGEGALEWYNALFSLSESEYESVTSHAPYGYVAVTTFKSDTLVNQIIQVKDSVGHVGVFGRYWTKNERRWYGKANTTNSLDGNVKKVNGVKPDLYGNVNVESSRSTPKVNLTRHYIEMTSEDRIVEVDAPGIKPDNYTFTVLLNDTGLRATNWDWSIDEEREKLIIDYHANRSKAGLTIMLTIFS